MATRGMRRRAAVVWLTGNDIYDRTTKSTRFNQDSLASVAVSASEVCRRSPETTDGVIILGPISRPSGEVIELREEADDGFPLGRRIRHSQPCVSTHICI